MTLLALIMVGLQGQAEVARFGGVIEDSARLLRFTIAHDALAADEALLGLHRGMRVFLDREAALDLSETAYRRQLRLASVRGGVEAFEEALLEDPEGARLFDAYYDALGKDADLAAAVDALHRREMEALRRDPGVVSGIEYLKRHPDEAVVFLNNPLRLLPTPDALRPLRDRFRRDANLQGQLKTSFDTLDTHAGARESIFLWWAETFEEESVLGKAYRSLQGQLMRFPQRFRVWHGRQAAWTLYPAQRDWARHFYGEVRRDGVLRATYFEYAARLVEFPELQDAVEQDWREEFGPAPEWPPSGQPPELAAWGDREEERLRRPERPDREALMPRRPAREDIRIPERPSRPEAAVPEVSRPRSGEGGTRPQGEGAG